MSALSPELLAILGVVFVHLIPKLLQRIRIPGPVGALLLGMLVSFFWPELGTDPTLALLSTIGIASLFLFAGLEVDADELGKKPTVLLAGLAAHASLLGLATLFGVFVLHLDIAPSMLLGLGLVTPSGGFILDGLAGLGADERERNAIRDAALTAEILALVVFFGVTQASSLGQMALALFTMVAMTALVPVALRTLSRWILPVAPKSEFALLVLTAVVCAFATRKLGVYYLVGAFVVGVVARRLQHEVPELASEKNLSAIELFAAFFAPFYFARAGMSFDPGTIGWKAIGLGALLALAITPLRMAVVAVARHVSIWESLRADTRVATAIIPTFVFSLVMARVLADRHDAPSYVVSGLLAYAVFNAFVPTLVFARLARPAEPEPPAVAEAAPQSPRPEETLSLGDEKMAQADDVAPGAETAPDSSVPKNEES